MRVPDMVRFARVDAGFESVFAEGLLQSLHRGGDDGIVTVGFRKLRDEKTYDRSRGFTVRSFLGGGEKVADPIARREGR